jgi:hypothetical protein
MEHTNGAKAYDGVQPKIQVPHGKTKRVDTKYGPGHQLKNGEIVGIGRDGKPFHIDKSGQKHAIGFGNHKIGGQKIRLFEAATVHVVTPDGRMMRYDSRGNVRMGRSAAERAAAAAAASVTGGGGTTAPAPGAPTTATKGGPESTDPAAAQKASLENLKKMVEQLQALLAQLGVTPGTTGSGGVGGSSGLGGSTGVDHGQIAQLPSQFSGMLGGPSQALGGAFIGFPASPQQALQQISDGPRKVPANIVGQLLELRPPRVGESPQDYAAFVKDMAKKLGKDSLVAKIDVPGASGSAGIAGSSNDMAGVTSQLQQLSQTLTSLMGGQQGGVNSFVW